MSAGDRRTEATIAAELAELRRHLEQAPPHHGGGRAESEDRVRQLERELAAVRHEKS